MGEGQLGTPSLDEVRLETARLVLRELTLDDVAAVQDYAVDPEVYRYMPWGPNTPEQTAEFIRSTIDARHMVPRRAYELAVVRKDTGRLVGAAGCRVRSLENLEGDIGYALRREAWGQGLATEAAAALVEFGLGTLGLHRVWATCHVDNARSARVLEKVGMQREGRLRDLIRTRGAWRDSWLYALIEGDPGIKKVLVGR
jgi:[ribosomal protein S5]-alanine N-acetyltransferase